MVRLVNPESYSSTEAQEMDQWLPPSWRVWPLAVIEAVEDFSVDEDEFDCVGSLYAMRAGDPVEEAFFREQQANECCGWAEDDVVVPLEDGTTVTLRVGWSYGH